MLPWEVAKLPARSAAARVTEKLPPFAGVTHSSFGLPPPTVARFLETTFEPCRIVIVTGEIFDSEIFTPARVPPASLGESRGTTGGVVRAAGERGAVVEGI